jgi:hypothetical protein
MHFQVMETKHILDSMAKFRPRILEFSQLKPFLNKFMILFNIFKKKLFDLLIIYQNWLEILLIFRYIQFNFVNQIINIYHGIRT